MKFILGQSILDTEKIRLVTTIQEYTGTPVKHYFHFEIYFYNQPDSESIHVRKSYVPDIALSDVEQRCMNYLKITDTRDQALEKINHTHKQVMSYWAPNQTTIPRIEEL